MKSALAMVTAFFVIKMEDKWKGPLQSRTSSAAVETWTELCSTVWPIPQPAFSTTILLCVVWHDVVGLFPINMCSSWFFLRWLWARIGSVHCAILWSLSEDTSKHVQDGWSSLTLAHVEISECLSANPLEWNSELDRMHLCWSSWQISGARS